jgi:plasmid replication initiation protein
MVIQLQIYGIKLHAPSNCNLIWQELCLWLVLVNGIFMDNNALVVKSNALVEASYRLSLNEQRLILSCISQIRRDEPVTDKIMYSISASEFAKICSIDPKIAYQQLQSAAITLKRREVRITQEPNGQGRRKKTLIANWVQTIEYTEGEGTVKLRFNHDMLPYLTELSRCFTSYKLKNVICMSSSYGVRIYELLTQWKSLGEKEFSIENLKQLLQVENQYLQMCNFKARVLDPAIKDINKNSDIWVKWSQKKTGRKVTHLIFQFGPKEEQKTKNPKNEIKILGVEKSVVEKHARRGETYEQAAMRIKNKNLETA